MSELKIEDVAKMVAVFKVNYNAYNGASPEDIDTLIEIWYNKLKQYPQEIVAIAFDKLLNVSKYLPNLASFIEQIELVQNSAEKSEFELWDELNEAIYQASVLAGRLGYNAVPLGETKTQGEIAREEFNNLFNSLSPIVKEYVASKQGLLDLCDVDLEFEKGRFLKAYPNLKERVKIKNEMPKQIYDILNEVKFKQIKDVDVE